MRAKLHSDSRFELRPVVCFYWVCDISDWPSLIGAHQGADVREIDGGRPVVLSEDERDTPCDSALRRY
jgi:hypothetical protein